MTDSSTQTGSETTGAKSHILAIRRPVTMAMLFLTLAVFGAKSYQELPINLMPDISYPSLTVRTEYEGAAPEDVEKLLTRPLEETLSIVSGMVEISSVSQPGLSEIVMEFTWGTDMNVAQQDVRDRLDLFVAPQDVTEKPVILRFDPTLDPVMRVAVTGPDRSSIADERARFEQTEKDLTVIRDAAERHIKNDLEGELGIAQVQVKGGREEEIQILVDSEKLKNLGLSLESIKNNLAQQNINLSGGRLKEGKTEYLVRTLNEFEQVEQIQETIITVTPEGRQIKLADVANVTVGEKDRETVVRIDSEEAVELAIYKWGDANTVQVCNQLKDLLGFEREYSLMERVVKSFQKAGEASGESPADPAAPTAEEELAKIIKDRLPDDAQIHLISDQSRFIVNSIKEVQNSALFGGFLAIAVLYFFLREMKSTVIIGVAIPISVIATFVPMFIQHVSLNIMSLGGLALGVGMLVDNSIVVLESIFRCREEGDDPVNAADRGTREVGSAVIASTLTSIAVFVPITFVEGVAGQLFRDQALTVTYSLSASLLAALFLVPMIASRQKLALQAGYDVIWVLKAYRMARNESHRGRVVSALLIPLNAARLARRWLAATFRETFRPMVKRWFPSLVEQEDGVVKGSLALAILLLPLELPFFVSLFVALLLVNLLASFLILVLFVFSVVALAILWAVGIVLRVLLWFPLLAFEFSYRMLSSFYIGLLRQSLRLSVVVLALVAVLAVCAGYTAKDLGRELIPSMKQGEFGIRMEAPPGTQLEQTERQTREIENLALAIPEVESVAVEVGQEKDKASGERGENVALFTISLKNPEINVAKQDDIIERLRTQVEAVTSNKITFTLPTLFSFKTAVELQVRGDDLDELRRVGEEALRIAETIEGLEDADLSMKKGYPEVIIELDRDLLAAKGLTPATVAQRLSREVQGEVASRFNRGGTKVDMRVRTDRERLASLDDLRRLSVVDGTPPIPLSSVATIEVEDGPSEIRRIDQRQVAVITGNVVGRDLGAVSNDLWRGIQGIDRPDDIEFAMGGQNRELDTSSKSLQFALILATFLVYVVMACQFESLWMPAMVMASIPLAFVGVIFALDALSIDISIVVYIGGIILAGIVVNNAIVLVDYVNQLRARGMRKRDAVVEAARVRLRPIMMTTVTTVLGLIPMAVWSGEGAEMRRPLAWTIIAGLSSATLLTLVIIPMVYDLLGGRDKNVEPEIGAED